MTSYEKRISHLEGQVEKHLEEAGEVRESIRDSKRIVENISGRVEAIYNRLWATAVAVVSILLALVGFLLKEIFWK